MENFKINTMYVVWVENDETEPFVAGIATNEERATKMIDVMKNKFDNLFEYNITPIVTDKITIDDEDVFFK